MTASRMESTDSWKFLFDENQKHRFDSLSKSFRLCVTTEIGHHKNQTINCSKHQLKPSVDFSHRTNNPSNEHHEKVHTQQRTQTQTHTHNMT